MTFTFSAMEVSWQGLHYDLGKSVCIQAIFIYKWQLWNLFLACHVEICFLKKTAKIFAPSPFHVIILLEYLLVYPSWLIVIHESLGWTVLEGWVKSLGDCVGVSVWIMKRGPSSSLISEFLFQASWPQNFVQGPGRVICFRPGQVILSPASRNHDVLPYFY